MGRRASAFMEKRQSQETFLYPNVVSRSSLPGKRQTGDRPEVRKNHSKREREIDRQGRSR